MSATDDTKKAKEEKNLQERKEKGVTGKIFTAATQKHTNTHLPTQEGWTAEGKVIPISDRLLSCATVSHTHTLTRAGQIHKPISMKTHRLSF